MKVSFEIKMSTVWHCLLFIVKGALSLGLVLLFVMLLTVGIQIVNDTVVAVHLHTSSATSLELQSYGIGFGCITVALFPMYLVFKLWRLEKE